MPVANVESVLIDYNGKKIKAKKLIVRSVLPMNIDKVWNNVKSPALLEFVAKGMITFRSTDGGFPNKWEMVAFITKMPLPFMVVY